eukprot:gb/GECG01016038.1/.p1 GENE.gb/GECG01016038.1/~~gb/GECG01016038.1/.p1  ORF type:complete len:496 (+),score=43.58 gb/GECG01016038.1/:1-1488(+)
MRHHVGGGYPHTHAIGGNYHSVDIEDGGGKMKGRGILKGKPVGEYVQVGEYFFSLTWKRLLKWIMCVAIIVVCLDLFVEAVDHVITEHGDKNAPQGQGLHTRHATLLQKGIEADLHSMRASLRTARGSEPYRRSDDSQAEMVGLGHQKREILKYKEAEVLDDFCEDTDLTGTEVSTESMLQDKTAVHSRWIHVGNHQQGYENWEARCPTICSWKDRVDSAIPFGLCTFDPQQDPHISKAIQEMGLWNGMKKDIHQFALPTKNFGRTVYIDVGANLGFYSILATKRGYDAIILEPSREQISEILCSLSSNGIRIADTSSGMNRSPKIRENNRAPTAWVFQNAAYDRSLQVPFKFEEHNPGASHLDPRTYRQTDTEVNAANTVVLDELIFDPEFGLDPTDVHMIKISAEMSDVRVLRGARRLLAQGKIPFVHMVFNQEHIRSASCDPRKLLYILRDYGYKLYESNVYHLKDSELEAYLAESQTGSMELLFVGPDNWF